MNQPYLYLIDVDRSLKLLLPKISTLNAIPLDFEEIMLDRICQIISHYNADLNEVTNITIKIQILLQRIFMNTPDFSRVEEFTVLFTTIAIEMIQTIQYQQLRPPYRFVKIQGGELFIEAYRPC